MEHGAAFLRLNLALLITQGFCSAFRSPQVGKRDAKWNTILTCGTVDFKAVQNSLLFALASSESG
jgi:hypothetical protein